MESIMLIFRRQVKIIILAVSATFLLLKVLDSSESKINREFNANCNCSSLHAQHLCSNDIQMAENEDEYQIDAEKALDDIFEMSTTTTTTIQMKEDTLPTIHVITPTYNRSVQIAELTRFSHTLRLVKNIHWILIEDARNKTSKVATFLRRSEINHTHLNIKHSVPSKKGYIPRGMLQRNAGLDWIRKNLKDDTTQDVVYFADDDNTYDLRVFDEMRWTRTVSIWPVGLAGGLPYEGPVCENNSVTGWIVNWAPNRTFPIDMAGFAISVQRILERPKAVFNVYGSPGELESEFLSKLVKQEELEPKADLCKSILVWHTQTQPTEMDKQREKERKDRIADLYKKHKLNIISRSDTGWKYNVPRENQTEMHSKWKYNVPVQTNERL